MNAIEAKAKMSRINISSLDICSFLCLSLSLLLRSEFSEVPNDKH